MITAALAYPGNSGNWVEVGLLHTIILEQLDNRRNTSGTLSALQCAGDCIDTSLENYQSAYFCTATNPEG